MRRSWITFASLFVLFLSAVPNWGQNITGEIDGTVHDSSGAAIVGATVMVTNTDTNQLVRTVKTNSTGEYTASLLQVGTYKILVQSEGFQQSTLTGITLNVGDTLSKDVQLTPGAETEVTVTANSQRPDVETNESASLIDQTQMKELALNTRNFEQMLLLQPGVSYGGPDELNTGQIDPTGARNTHGLSFNGLQPTQVMFLLDGADMVNHTSNAQVSIFPSIDAIKQIQSTRNNYGAQYGGGGNAQVTIVSKAGGADFHGDAYFFWRNKILNATPVFDLLSNPKIAKPNIRYNVFGYTIGGPVFIPTLYPRSKSKTFFFFSEEFRRLDNFITQTNSEFPTLAETYGYFQTDPCLQYTTGTNGKAGCAAFAPEVTNSPYPGFNYQVKTIDPVAAAYMKDMFRPAIALAPPPFSSSNVNQVLLQQYSTTSETQEMVRLDHQFSERLSVFFRWIYDPITQNIPNSLYVGGGLPGVSQTIVNTYGEDFLGHGTWTAGPNTVLDFGYSYLPYQTKATPTGSALAANSPDVQVNLPYANTTGRVPALVIVSPFWGATGPFTDQSHTTQIFENTTHTIGRHTLYFGVNFEYLTDAGNLGTTNAGQFTFRVSSLVAPPKPFVQANQFEQNFANVLLAQPTSFTQASIDPYSEPHENLYEGYIQDNWRATRNFTVNAGVRYSIFQAPGDFSPDTNHEFPNGKLGSFQPEAYSAPQAATLGYDGTLCTATTVKATACSGLTVNPAYSALNGIVGGGASTSPYGHALSRTPLLDFAPRVGFAWNAYGDGKTSVRGGFGIYFEQQPLSTFQSSVAGNPAYVQNPVYNNPGSLSMPAVSSGNSGGPVLVIGGLEKDWKQPYVEAWNLDVQQQIGPNDMLDIGYVGNNTMHLEGEEDLNQPTPNLYLTNNTTQGVYPTTSSLAACYPASTTASCPTEQALNRIRPYPGWGPISYLSTRYFADYNGLQVSLLHRAGKRAIINLNYTFSRAMANSNGAPLSIAVTRQFDPQNRYNLKPEWGPTLLDRRNIFVASAVYELPKHSAWHGFRGALVNGWELSSIVQLEAGLWWSSYQATYDPAGQGGGASGSQAQLRPDENANPNHGPKTIAEWFKNDKGITHATTGTTWTEEPTQGQVGGNVGIGTILGPGYENYNLDVFKTFELPETMSFQLRLEGFNIFNHVNAQNIGINAAATNFGQVTSANDNRELQLGAKLYF